MGWSNYSHYENDYRDDRGGNDEYYVAECDWCDKRTEHDVCTDECVECQS